MAGAAPAHERRQGLGRARVQPESQYSFPHRKYLGDSPGGASRGGRLHSSLSSVPHPTPLVGCEERQRLILIYLDATEAHRKASESVDGVQSPVWLEATKETRQACERALAALKLHIREHGC